MKIVRVYPPLRNYRANAPVPDDTIAFYDIPKEAADIVAREAQLRVINRLSNGFQGAIPQLDKSLSALRHILDKGEVI